jgi:hypothetical protein
MDAQEFRSLQEAYLEVYQELDEASPIYSRGGEQRRTQTPRQIGVKGAPHNIPKGGTTISDRDPEGKRLFTGEQDRGKGSKAARRAAALKPKEKKFPNRLRRADGQGIRDSYEYDLYDIILSHLLDEGYAETPEAAQVIMVNMSEEWREEIMEGMTMKDFKANRKKLQRKEASDDAKKRGHVDKFTGKPYGTAEAASRRRNLNPAERESRRKFAENPD